MRLIVTNPVLQVLLFLVALVLLGVAFIVGALILAVLAGIATVVGLTLWLRYLLMRGVLRGPRHTRRQPPPRRGQVIEGEYRRGPRQPPEQ